MRLPYIIAGSLSLALGIIGIFVPLLPTTPFLLLAAAAYSRGSTRLYQWLINHKYLGPYIRNFREYKAIPLKAKIASISLLWATIGFSIFFAGMPLPVQILLGAIAIGVTWHILSFKTLKKGKNP
ncbi:MAG: YbaN family protein [Proteobacteria bacterium]|nr:YbaN family protein [Pseudomonadota bacterium]